MEVLYLTILFNIHLQRSFGENVVQQLIFVHLIEVSHSYLQVIHGVQQGQQVQKNRSHPEGEK